MIASTSWITGMGGKGISAHSFVRSRLLPEPLLQRTSIGAVRGERWGQGMWMLRAEQLEAASSAPRVAPLDIHRGGWQGNPDSLWGGQHLGNSRLASRTWCQHSPCAPQWMVLGCSGCLGASIWALGASQCTGDTRPSAQGYGGVSVGSVRGGSFVVKQNPIPFLWNLSLGFAALLMSTLQNHPMPSNLGKWSARNELIKICLNCMIFWSYIQNI